MICIIIEGYELIRFSVKSIMSECLCGFFLHTIKDISTFTSPINFNK